MVGGSNLLSVVVNAELMSFSSPYPLPPVVFSAGTLAQGFASWLCLLSCLPVCVLAFQ